MYFTQQQVPQHENVRQTCDGLATRAVCIPSPSQRQLGWTPAPLLPAKGEAVIQILQDLFSEEQLID